MVLKMALVIVHCNFVLALKDDSNVSPRMLYSNIY